MGSNIPKAECCLSMFLVACLATRYGGCDESVPTVLPSVHRPGCVMRGPCSDDTGYGSKNCHVVQDPTPLEDEEGQQLLREVCPDLAARGDRVCCSKEQLQELQSNLVVPARLGLRDCPACLSNFRKIFCHFTCSSRQAHFVRVVDASADPASGKEVVHEVDYHMHRDFAHGLFASCEGIRGLLGSSPLDLLCGSWGSECTVERWLSFLGSSSDNGGFAPFQINFRLTEERVIQEEGGTYHPMAANVTKCSEAPPEGGEPCRCEDCQEACAR